MIYICRVEESKARFMYPCGRQPIRIWKFRFFGWKEGSKKDFFSIQKIDVKEDKWRNSRWEKGGLLKIQQQLKDCLSLLAIMSSKGAWLQRDLLKQSLIAVIWKKARNRLDKMQLSSSAPSSSKDQWPHLLFSEKNTNYSALRKWFHFCNIEEGGFIFFKPFKLILLLLFSFYKID